MLCVCAYALCMHYTYYTYKCILLDQTWCMLFLTLWVHQLCREVALDPSAVLPPGAIWRRVDYPVPFCGRHHSPSFSPCLRHTASAALAPWPRRMRRQLLPPLPRNYSFTTECLNNRLQILCIYVQPFSSHLSWLGTSVPVVKIST